MRKLNILLVIFWAFGFVLLHQLGEADMDALTDEQMGAHYVKTWNLSVPENVEAEPTISNETDELMEDEEETKLDNYLEEASPPELGEPFKRKPILEITRWTIESEGNRTITGREIQVTPFE